MADAFVDTYKTKHPELAARADEARRDARLERLKNETENLGLNQPGGDGDDVDTADAMLEAEARVVQEEFWRIVETDVESVRVEYGSDLDADVYGTGFAPTTSDSDSVSTHHAWDFNELIHHPSNLLRVVGSDVPGLTRP